MSDNFLNLRHPKPYLLLAATILLGFSLVYGFMDKTGAMTVAASSAAVLAFLAFLDQIAEFTVGPKGIAVKRAEDAAETAEGAADNARQAAEDAKYLAIATAKVALREASEEECKEICEVLKRHDTDQPTLNQLRSLWSDYRLAEFRGHLISVFRNRVGQHQVQRKKLITAAKTFSNEEDFPERFEELLDSNFEHGSILTQHMKQRIEDYRYLREHGTIRNPDDWERRHEWTLDGYMHDE